MIHDVIIVGGSFAGLAAGLQLARARKRLAVIDAGQRRNRFADSSHGFLGQDGEPPAAIVGEARRQLLAYPTAELIDATVTDAVAEEESFTVSTADGARYRTRRLVLATGVVDELPDIEGLRERWGQHVFHCPYCHGYELQEGDIGVIATSPMSVHQALLVSEWGRVTLMTNGMFVPDAEQAAALAARNVRLEDQPIAAIGGKADVVFENGETVSFGGLFTASRTRMASPLAERLGCRFIDGPMGSYIETSGFMKTSVPGVFACGDAARGAGSVSMAVGDGAMAGVGAHQSLVFPGGH